MTTDGAGGRPSYALLTNGAGFARAVLQALLRRDCPPRLLVLPEYPPASVDSAAGLDLEPAVGLRPIVALAGDIEIAYAPAARQTECGALISARGIEFLLVACWPYLIGPALLASVPGAALNLHPSLLPKYRGADPLEQQAGAGDGRYGVTLHLLDASFDHGDIVAQAELSDGNRDECMDPSLRCAELGALLVLEALGAYPNWSPVPQDSLIGSG